MTECFVEEFMRLGYNHKQILAMFRNPHYIGMNMALQNRGERFVRERIEEVFARWGRPVQWEYGVPASAGEHRSAAFTPLQPPSTKDGPIPEGSSAQPAEAGTPNPASLTDPMGAPIPDVTL
jgi:hypothetical protein